MNTLCPPSQKPPPKIGWPKSKDPEFVQAGKELEPGYQIARLRIQRGLTQSQLAELVGTNQPSIARLEIFVQQKCPTIHRNTTAAQYA
jgi:hypothetical protein